MTEVAAAVEAVSTAARTDLPVIMADIHAATATLSSVATEVGANLTVASGRIDGLATNAESALAGATLAFANANDTLSEINAALVTGESALLAAERAFAGADRVINEEAARIAEELRATLTGLDIAVAQVAADLPEVAADVRAASAAARASFTELERVVAASGPSVEGFMTTALPSYRSLAQESRSLVANLDALVTAIQGDPLRFLLSE
jgi:phospholipid/cholesterol/gamma-HCH transport system substrate-binding protein